MLQWKTPTMEVYFISFFVATKKLSLTWNNSPFLVHPPSHRNKNLVWNLKLCASNKFARSSKGSSVFPVSGFLRNNTSGAETINSKPSDPLGGWSSENLEGFQIHGDMVVNLGGIKTWSYKTSLWNGSLTCIQIRLEQLWPYHIKHSIFIDRWNLFQKKQCWVPAIL